MSLPRLGQAGGKQHRPERGMRVEPAVDFLTNRPRAPDWVERDVSAWLEPDTRLTSPRLSAESLGFW